MSGTSFISAQPQQEPFPDVFGNFLKARDNALAYRTNTFNLDALQQKQAQEQQINALAPRILAGDQAAYEQAIAINPAYAQGIQTARGQFEQTGANTAHINAVTGEMPTRLGIAQTASNVLVNQDQRAGQDLTLRQWESGRQDQELTLRQQQDQRAAEDLAIRQAQEKRAQQEAIAKMTDVERRRALDNIDIMARVGGSLMSTYPDTTSRTAAWPAARADIIRLTGNDPGEAYPGDARVQQFLTQAQSAPDLFKNATTGIGAAPPGFYGGPGAAPAAPAPNSSDGTPPRQQAAPRANAQQFAGPYAAAIQNASQRNSVPPALATAVMIAESGGDPNAVSGAGARGLFQLMPGTARELGVQNPHDPMQSIEGGTRYLGQMLSKYGGNPEIALAAYNWGPGNVDKWLARGANPAELPRETQQYIARITGTMGGFAPGGQMRAPGPQGPLPTPGTAEQFPTQTTPADFGIGPGMQSLEPAAPAQAPAPLPAALVGTGPLAQAANAAAVPPRPSVSGLPDGYEYAMTPQGQFYTHGAPAGKVWAWRPGDPSSKTVVDLPGAKSTEERKVAFDQADKLRDEWNKATAPFVLTQNAYNTMQRAQENPSAAGDLSMIFGFMKMLDPTSTVREGEAASVQNAGGISDRVRNVYNSILSGERLTEEQRKDLVSQSENLFKVSQKHYDNTKEQYGALADHFGVPRKAVLVEHARPQTDGQAGPRPAQLPIMATPADAMKLPPGTRFLDANGVERMRP